MIIIEPDENTDMNGHFIFMTTFIPVMSDVRLTYHILDGKITDETSARVLSSIPLLNGTYVGCGKVGAKSVRNMNPEVDAHMAAKSLKCSSKTFCLKVRLCMSKTGVRVISSKEEHVC